MKKIKINLIKGFHFVNLILIIFYLYPGSIFGYFLYNNSSIQPQITEDFSILDLQEINEENIDEEIAKHIQQADVEDLSSNLEQFSDNIDEKLISFEQESKEVMKKVEQSIAGVEKVENRIDELNVSTNSIIKGSVKWKVILNKAKLKANKKHVFKNIKMKRNKVNFLKISIYPDGGISRIRAFGKFSK